MNERAESRGTSSSRGRFPPWMRKSVPSTGRSAEVAGLIADLNLQTVCRGAQCPNQAECFSRGVATFMILGATCTRDCRFCAVQPGRPGEPNPREPEAVAAAAARLGLGHVVITSVTRDDLPDGGASHFAATIRAVRDRLGDATVEVLTPDFLGQTASVDTVLAARPDVFNHNIETVRRLYPAVRPQADYNRSLAVLAHAARGAKADGDTVRIKSGLMVGFGETDDEIRQVLIDLRAAGVNMLTIGQYLAPSAKHAPVVRFVHPDQYEHWRQMALEMGFAAAAAGPYVRSSYLAEGLLRAANG